MLQGLTNGNVTRSTNVNLSSLTNGNIPKMTDMQILPIVCTWLHMGHAKQPFALKGCRNPARHIFPWLPGEAVGLHTGVLTKTFEVSVLYLKTVYVFFKRKLFDKSVH